MRVALTIIVFVMVGTVLAGSFLIVLLSGPFTGQSIQEMILWFGLGGFAVALPVSYAIAGYILAKTKPKTPVA